MNPAAGPSLLETLLPFVVILGFFYLFFLRPQAKKMKEHDLYLRTLKRGDAVITASGILGTVDGMTDTIVTLEIASGVKMKVLRKQVLGSQASLDKAPTTTEKK